MNFIKVCESCEQFKYTVLVIKLFVKVLTNFENFIKTF